MGQVAVVTDSIAGIPQEYIDQLQIYVLPNILLWSGQEFRDGVDITPEQFYARLRADHELPTTAAAPPSAFLAVFKELVDAGRDVLGIFTGSRLSAIYANAVQARDELGRSNVTLIDSETITMMVGWATIQAALAAHNGADLAICEAIARNALQNSGGYMVFDKLEYLRRSGRISSAQLLVGSALNLKPVLSVVGGELQVVTRVRTLGKAVQHMIDLVEQDTQGKRMAGLAVMHADVPDQAQELLRATVDRFRPQQSILTPIGPNLGTHAGPGALGIAFMAR